MFRGYPRLGRHEQLRDGGRELLGRDIYWTEKRDGQNVCIYCSDEGYIYTGSHRQEIASNDILESLVDLRQYWRSCQIVRDEPHLIVYLEHVMKGHGPTRVEKPKKHASLVLIDIYDTRLQRYLPYNSVYQYAHKYRLPVVKCYGISPYYNLDSLKIAIDAYLKFCRRHRREGVVGKVYDFSNQIFFKEKIDLPKLQRVKERTTERPVYPAMPEDIITRAIERALHECNANNENVRDPKFAMPRVNNHLTAEAREHYYSVPRDMFQRYMQAIAGLER